MSNNTIDETLDLAPLPDEEKNLPSIDVSPQLQGDAQVDSDAEYARRNLYDIITSGQRAMDELLDIANQSQNPRAYEVVGGLLKNLVEANKDLLQLHKSKKEIKQTLNTPQQPTGGNRTNNNIFVGSTDELLKLMNGDAD